MEASVIPAGRFFPAPLSPFDTEVAVTLAANARVRGADRRVVWIATREEPRLPRFVLVRRGADLVPIVRELERERRVATETLTVMTDAIEDGLSVGRALGVPVTHVSFFALPTRATEAGRGDASVLLEPAVGDAAWRTWAAIERSVLVDLRRRPVTEAFVDRSVDFKRRQQRGSPPIRRFVARDRTGAPVGMIGYAPFESCDFGVGQPGRAARLRDVAIVPEARRRGLGRAMIHAAIEAAIDELGATQVLIAADREASASRLYRGLGAREIGGFAQLTV